MWIPFRRTSGTPFAERNRRSFTFGALAMVMLAGTSCNYSLRGGSFPDHIQTVAVLPFENQTTRLELTQELFDVMSRELPRALGIRAAAADNADAIVQGVIQNYNLSTPNYRPSDTGDRAEVLQRQVTIVIQVELIDRAESLILWDSSNLRGEGQYLEESETEEDGKLIALELIVQRIVDGAQSNW